jgi:hypothetical protein
VLFFDHNWNLITPNNSNGVEEKELATEISGIDIEDVRKEYLIWSPCAALRMS